MYFKEKTNNSHQWSITFKILIPIIMFVSGISCATAEQKTNKERLSYSISASISPSSHELSAKVKMRFSPHQVTHQLSFALNANLDITQIKPEPNTIQQTKGKYSTQYSISFEQPINQLYMEYHGQVLEPPSQQQQESRVMKSTRGQISPDGVFLSGATAWYPITQHNNLSFELQVNLPDGWSSVSQGAQTALNYWQDDTPQQEIYLIAAPFHLYTRKWNNIEIQVWLRQEDAELAERFLGASEQNLATYTRMLGDYPYPKFALVENFWQTGYGMPSFTLMGSRVIRFPFILYSSFPHEVLHNWWGNGVYVDYQQGNWSEGLTSYLADHALQELRSSDVEYRRGVLQKYSDFAAKQRDFSLSSFVARHDPATEAVGYGKALMFFHMLRLQLGDTAFIKALRQFYQQNLYQIAGYDQLQQAFEESSGTSLEQEFKQWIKNSGAPTLSVDGINVRALEEQGGYELKFSLHQKNVTQPYKLQIPVAILLNGEESAQRYVFELAESSKEYLLTLASSPHWIGVDPEYDVFRHLFPQETPAAFAQLYGSQEVSFILPARFRTKPQLHQPLTRRGGYWQSVNIVYDDEVTELPKHGTVWLLGWDNRLRHQLKDPMSRVGARFEGHSLIIDDQHINSSQSVAMIVHDESRRPLVWAATITDHALAVLARKLPHYNKYSYLVFDNATLDNRIKHTWAIGDSPLKISLDPTVVSSTVKLPRQEPLIRN